MPVNFGGMKFWVSKTVPSDVRQKILDHGGAVVILERDANLCVTDHRRNPTHTSAYSYTYVNDMIAAGELLGESRYKVPEMIKRDIENGQTFAQRQAVVSRGRRVRTEFTANDDKILTEYVLRRDLMGDGIQGFKVFQDFERLYPHHSWQSWRERWKRKLQFVVVVPSENQTFANRAQKRTEEKRRAKEQGEPSSSARSRQDPPSSQVTVPDPESEEPADPVEPVVPASSSEPQRIDRMGPGSMSILSDEDLFLLNAIRKAEKQGLGRVPTRIFEALHEKYPNTSAAEWQERYEELRVWQLSDTRHEQPTQSQPQPPESQSQSQSQSRSQQHALPTARERDDEILEEVLAEQALDAPEHGAYADEQEAQHIPHEVPPEDGLLSDLAPLDSAGVEHATARRQDLADSQELSVEPGLSDMSILDEVAAQDQEEDDFYHHLDEFSEQYGIYVPTSFFIGGVNLQTWTLWMTVKEISPDPENRDWPSIVKSLGFDVTKYPALEVNLARWFNHNLSYLEKALALFQAANSEDGEEEDGEEDGEEEEDADADDAIEATNLENGAIGATQEGNAGEETTPKGAVTATPRKTLIGSAKRVFEAVFASGSHPTPVAKRVRVEVASDQHPASSDHEDDEDDDEAFEAPPGLSRPRAIQSTPLRQQHTPLPGQFRWPPSAAAEPETQDFAYDPETQVGAGAEAADMGEGLDTTPSQQLYTEDRVVQAHPLSLPGSRAWAPRLSASPSAPRQRVSSSSVSKTSRRSLPASFGAQRASGEASTLPPVKEVAHDQGY